MGSTTYISLNGLSRIFDGAELVFVELPVNRHKPNGHSTLN